MFNGIIFNVGEVKAIKKEKKSILISISSNLRIRRNDIGSSISCNGVCLTLVKLEKKRMFFYISSETLKKSNFKNIKVGNKINL